MKDLFLIVICVTIVFFFSVQFKENSEFKPSDEVVKLPEYLPPDILVIINTIKETAENTSDEKLTHFTASMKELFLRYLQFLLNIFYSITNFSFFFF